MAFVIKDTPRKSNSEKRFTLRMDSNLYDQISAIAKLHRRSAGREIEEAIFQYVESFMENVAQEQLEELYHASECDTIEPEDQ